MRAVATLPSVTDERVGLPGHDLVERVGAGRTVGHEAGGQAPGRASSPQVHHRFLIVTSTAQADSPHNDVTPAIATRAPLGRVVATERKPNTPHEFHFWTAIDAPVGIGTIVRVEGPVPIGAVILRVYGVVTEGFSYSDLQSPLHDGLGHDGQPGGGASAATERTEIRLYTAQVLRHVPEEPLQPVPLGVVYLADDADVAVALRMDSYIAGEQSTGIPIGVYRAGGMRSPIFEIGRAHV